MRQGTANLAEDYCFIHKALRPLSKARRQIAAVPPSNSRPATCCATCVEPNIAPCEGTLTILAYMCRIMYNNLSHVFSW